MIGHVSCSAGRARTLEYGSELAFASCECWWRLGTVPWLCAPE
jgi:hypothetical protein